MGDLVEQGAPLAGSASTPPSFLRSSQETSGAASAALKKQYRGWARVGFGVESERVNHGADALWLDPCDEHRDEGGANSATTSGGSASPARKIGFRQDESGVALSEALITFPIVLLVFAAFIEFGYAMSQWNQTVKALQYGARLAAVSDPLVSQAAFDAAFPMGAANPLNNGGATPNDASISVSCGPGYAACDAARLSRIVRGSDGVCGTAGDPRPGICDINWRIQPANLVVTYQRSGLGYWGRPEGAVLTMRFEVRNITFDLPLLGGLLGLDDITVPAHPVTITTEDLRTCSTC
ncbi:hypothetical protein SJ05684_c29780 [Sinorhizobium sojae CCBAU 05684]|uniref:TadE-like domain-containing protein n=1 Tax=Sinorhizobium sojae CCBAU 05684 TaxID=716928 RepID=A0A249PER0_9HYPH|nr:hypothetical protein SJ05684_c29780 [Sinorhizobium sojae CCBAU 05684]